MAITLPFPVRVAAGLLATGIDLVRSLPDDIPAIPVTLVGNAMRLSMKVQQEIATLATRGDELLGGVIGGPQEHPAWATFDDDQPVAPTPRPRPKPQSQPKRKPKPVATSAPGSPQRPAAASTPSEGTPEPADSKPVVAEPGAGEHAAQQHDTEEDDAQETGTTSLTTRETTVVPPVTTTAMDAAIGVSAALGDQAADAAEVPAGVADSATAAVEPPADSPDSTADEAETLATDDTFARAGTAGAGADAARAGEDPDAIDDLSEVPPGSVLFEETEQLTEHLPIPADLLRDEADDEPAALPGYDRMTLAQVRGHLRELTAADVSTLLRYEQDGDGRPPFLTLLSNRLVTLDARNS